MTAMTPPEQAELIERLRGLRPIGHLTGSSDYELVNPDGPEAAAEILALQAQVDALEAGLKMIETEANRANDVIRLNRDGQGQGRIKVATAMHRIAGWAGDMIEVGRSARQLLEDKP